MSFTFWLTNVSTSEVLVNAVRTSCGCTVAKLPSLPWHLGPGARGPIEVVMNVQGKTGKIVKAVTVDGNAGVKQLLVAVNVPAPAPGPAVSAAMAAIRPERLMNMQISKTDRQATLRGSCAVCHAQPAVGKEGRELYVTACAICHHAEHRASAVPDLQVMGSAKDAPYWKQFISEGKPSSMMPAFAREQGGFLTEQQIASLVAYLVGDFRKEGRIVYRDPTVPAPSVMKPAPPLTPAVMAPIPGALRTNGPGTGGTP